jgi:hypothetical protein
MLRLPYGLLAVALASAVIAGCGSDDSDDAPSSADVPAGAVATVGDEQIGKQDLAAQVAVLKRAQRGGDGMGQKQLETQALAALLTRAAIEQEAADRGVEVSPAEVRKSFRSTSRDQFRTRKALRRFLGGQTEQDLIAQLRLQELSERIGEQISKEAGGGKEGAKAVKDFQQELQKRWQDRTACAKGYTAPGCSAD